VGTALVELGLGAAIVPLHPTDHDRTLDVGAQHRSAGIDVDRPQQRGRLLTGQEAGTAFAQRRRIQRHPVVWQVHGDAALARIDVQRPPGTHRRRYVRDGIPHTKPPATTFDAACLIEVPTARRIQRAQLHVTTIDRGHAEPGSARGLLRVLTEAIGQIELGSDASQTPVDDVDDLTVDVEPAPHGDGGAAVSGDVVIRGVARSA
jgi:hypothetical protein